MRAESLSEIRYTERRTTVAASHRCVDLFAGAGGLAVGFRSAGWGIVAGNDVDPDAAQTFRLNFPEASFFEGPVSKLAADELLADCGIERGDLDCLVGGPPCQSFSHNNHHRSAVDERARLFEHYLTLVGALNPKTLVMENVPGILSIDGGRVVDEILASLKELGFDAVVGRLSAEEFGTPQLRRRVFIVASRIGAASELLPNPTHWSPALAKWGGPKERPAGATKRPVTVWQAIGDLPEIENGGGVQIAPWASSHPTTTYQREMRRAAPQLYNHVCHALASVNLDRIVHVPEGGNWRNVPRDLLPAGMKRARLQDHTKRYGRLSRGGFASTILTKCDPHWGAYVHPTQDRTISVREAARLQGFPDSFRFAGDNLSKHYTQVGNAVPIQVAQAIGSAVLAHVRQHDVKVAKARSLKRAA
ncbi:DNA methylase, C-5 cytosine-specific family [Polymorphum gilvum SL003B-26A1]|uniref:Cytosine-specific methyltransferase n=1 Tax=Polymorphum gilvum (strain LMG 25793 / CGMCC 1.9160 / SL003B-26A1) TaxID=991905 RepID=F2J5Q9_POLGS|nr:DNA methylase, C-5 cytosine-specific family [Polymorphum gilvum SL003B-26A1]